MLGEAHARPRRSACAPRSSRSTPAMRRARRRCSARSSSALPTLGIVPDLLAAARRRAGDRAGPRARADARSRPGASATRSLASSAMRDLAAAHERWRRGARALPARARDAARAIRSPRVPLVRVATQLREPAPIAALALAQLRAAESAGDGTAKAEAYELLAHIDKDLRNDAGSAQVALESASQADPSRVDLMHRLEREYTVADQLAELLRLRRAEIEQIPAELAKRSRRADHGHRDARASAISAPTPSSPSCTARRSSPIRAAASRCSTSNRSSAAAGASVELATARGADRRVLRGRAAHAGRVLHARRRDARRARPDRRGRPEVRQGRRSRCPATCPRSRAGGSAALKGQLWIDVAEAANRQAAVAGDPSARRELHHFAGVVLMDKALVGEQAMIAFRRALEADPSHRDAFLRLRILLEEDANHDELAILLAQPARARDRSAARRSRSIARSPSCTATSSSDRDGAKQHYREILAADPNDLRAHAAIADIAWEQGSWQEAADALIARARLERDPADPEDAVLPARPDLRRSPRRRADGAQGVPARADLLSPTTRTRSSGSRTSRRRRGEWKLALGACERLVKAEQDADKRAAHLHRVAQIFRLGFGDMKRAERALNLALDGAPTNDEALTELVQFYRDAGDMASVRVHLNRVAGTMRARVQPEGGTRRTASRIA